MKFQSDDLRNDVVSFLGRKFILPFYKKKYKNFLGSLNSTSENQEKFLLSLVERSKMTDFGRNFSFAQIRSISDFQKKIPISEYRDLEPYFNRVASGDYNSILPQNENVLAFASTTGTTGHPKRIPVTRTWLINYQKWWQMWGVKANLDYPDIQRIRWLQITGSSDMDITKSGHQVGMVSAISAKYQNPIFQLFYATPRELGDLKNTEIRQYAISRLCMAYDIGFIITVTASNLITLAEIGNVYKEKIIRDIHDGTLSGLSEIASQSLRSKIQDRLKARKKRARQLEELLKHTTDLYPRHYWNTQLISCWTGGTVGHHALSLQKYYGDTAIRDIGYVSTEGRHTIPLTDRNPAGPLIPDGAFYEFMPLGSSQTLLPHELDVGHEYVVIITTSNGLYRYKFDDIVSCRGYVEKTPIIEFMRKTMDYSDLEGEKLSAQQVIAAIRETFEKYKVEIFDFVLFGERSENLGARYKIYCEKCEDNKIKDQNLLQLIDEIDKHLISNNFIYKQKRSDGSLEKPILHMLPQGTWKRFTDSQIKKRITGETQYKKPIFISPQQHKELLSFV